MHQACTVEDAHDSSMEVLYVFFWYKKLLICMVNNFYVVLFLIIGNVGKYTRHEYHESYELGVSQSHNWDFKI